MTKRNKYNSLDHSAAIYSIITALYWIYPFGMKYATRRDIFQTSYRWLLLIIYVDKKINATVLVLTFFGYTLLVDKLNFSASWMLIMAIKGADGILRLNLNPVLACYFELLTFMSTCFYNTNWRHNGFKFCRITQVRMFMWWRGCNLNITTLHNSFPGASVNKRITLRSPKYVMCKLWLKLDGIWRNLKWWKLLKSLQEVQRGENTTLTKCHFIKLLWWQYNNYNTGLTCWCYNSPCSLHGCCSHSGSNNEHGGFSLARWSTVEC